MPGVANPAGMVVSYDAYEFPVSIGPPQISIQQVYDSAGRVVVACRYTVSLEAVIYPAGNDANASLHMADLRVKLSAPAKELRVEGTGFSDLVVNEQGGRVWDCEWGPKPEVISCEQVGDDQAWRISWRCVAVVPEECPEETKPGLKRTYEWCYSIRWSIDERGLTTRTVQGHVMVPLTRLDPDSVLAPPDSADRLREAVKNIACPEGFRRIPGDATLSEDRRRLDFVVTDRQFDSPYAPPPGVILCSGRHEMGNSQSLNWMKFQHSITASYTVGRNVRKSDTLRHFLEMVFARWAHARRAKKALILPLTFSANEALWSQETSYGLAYATIHQDAALNDVRLRQDAMLTAISGGGLWVAPVKTTWDDWHASLKGDALESRGYAKLKWSTRDDKLVNVCVLEPPPDDGLRPLRPEGKLRNAPPEPPPPKDILQVFALSPPEARFGPDPNLKPENSFLSYDLSLAIKPIDDVARFKLLHDEDAEALYKPRERSLHEPGPHPEDYAQGKSPPHAFQFRAQPSFEAVLTGSAVRANYHVGRPTVISVGGRKAYPIRTRADYFEQRVLGNLLTPLVLARWRLTYALDGVPAPVAAPDHPVHGNVEGRPSLTGFTALS